MDKTFLLNRILNSDGTNQRQRILPALIPESIKIDERGIKDLLNFTYELAKEINFFNLDGVAEGDWQEFFNFPDASGTGYASYSEEEILAILQAKSDFSPDLALFLAFLQLFRLAQDDINGITRSHLNFYYTEVLSLEKKASIPDKVNIILELAKNLLQDRIAAGTSFKGKDPATGLALTYAADNEIVVNKAQIGSIKSLFIDAADKDTIWSSAAANSADGKGKPFPVPGSRWSAFGESQLGKTDQGQNMEEATVGFAFASPMLLLKEGRRVITLTIQFEDIPEPEIFQGVDISNGVEIYLSGAKDWIQPGIFTATISTTKLAPPPPPATPPDPPLYSTQLQLTVTLNPVDPAVVRFSSLLPGAAFDTPWPVMKVSLGLGAYLYNALYNFRVRSSTVSVAVNGVKDLLIQNDQSQLNPGKPFLPFGSSPTLNSAFYIGSAEVFQKKLSALSIDILWNDLPTGKLGDYYVPWFDSVTSLSNIIFTANVSILYKDNWLRFQNEVNPSTGYYFLFDVNDAKTPNEISISNSALSSALGGAAYTRNTALQQLAPLDNTTHDGFISLEITGPDPSVTPSFPFKAFGHGEYANIYAKRAIKIATVPDFTGVLPDPPYTPSIKSLSLNYISSQDLLPGDSSSPDQFFYVEPFGTAKQDPANPYLLPQFRDETNLPQLKANSLLYLGNFYLGISDLVPPQNLSVLFQVADGSADTNTIIQDEDLQWSYLADNKWVPITPLQIISNTTDGFQTSGIISLSIGSDADNDNTLMPAGLHWLRASVAKDPAGVSRLIDVRAQALEASYILPGAADAAKADLHLQSPLAPLSIKELVIKDAAIKSVLQPYQSFSGSPGEQDGIYYTRVSERLRHKRRALTLWDYERLILDAFPSIFKVKCLTHTDEDSGLAPGAVSAVVVPNLINKNSSNPLQPRAGLVTLQNVQDYIGRYKPVFVDFQVDNPVYEQLLVDLKVGFLPGKDPGFYGNLLNEDIKRFLSPWAYEEGQDITFGGKVFKSDIIVFIENRSYVDFVNDFSLYHIFDGVDSTGRGIGQMAIENDFIIGDIIPPSLDGMTIGLDFVVGQGTEVAVASGPRSILVSAPDHRITVLKTGEYACPGISYMGIGYMSVGGNFIVA